ncbi:uncharacterized protein [Euphorbia lathyris]|uniref:uncharacterized protein n=1 Tax=Euphorbia lathyris TaxID=212925 RepID=UPI0033144B3F
MLIICFSSVSSSSTLISFKPRSFSTSLPKLNHYNGQIPNKRKIIKKYGICRAELSRDAPFAAAIGACMLSSLLLPNTSSVDEEDSSSDFADARLTAMAIISFIPYFNWLSWVFAWLDTGKRRYAVYALVYLAPYVRSNMSLSPEESWLPIASIVLGIIHVQIETSIKNGDLEGFRLFGEASNFLSSVIKQKEIHSEDYQGSSSEEDGQEHMNFPSSKDRLKNEIGEWEVPTKPRKHPEHSNGDWEDDDLRKKL